MVITSSKRQNHYLFNIANEDYTLEFIPMYNQVIIVLIALFFFSACSNSPKSKGKVPIYQDGTLESTVLISAGESYSDFNALEIPSFFNIGLVKHDDSENPLKTIILSKRLNKGQTVNVKPLSLFTFLSDTTEYRFLVSSYATVENVRLGDNFTTFMSINNDLQMSIEYWFRAQCGIEKCKAYKWTQAYKAIRELQ